MMRRTNRKGRRPQGRSELQKFEQILHPPPIFPQIKHRQRLRFLCTTAGTQAVTWTNLLDSMFVALTASTAVQLWDTVRLHVVEVWAVGGTTDSRAPTTVTVEYPGPVVGNSGDGRVWADTSVGQTPAHVQTRPSSKSPGGLWQPNSTGTAFTLLNTPIGAVIDVECSFRNNNSAPQATAVAPVAATPGQFYYRGLDGQAIAGTKFPAQAPLSL